MSFGNVPRDLCLTSLATTRSIASKSANGYFSADIRTVGSLVKYQRSPGVWVTAADASLTVPSTQLGSMYTLPFNASSISSSLNGNILAVGTSSTNLGDSVVSIFTNTDGFYTQTAIPLPPSANINVPFFGTVSLNDAGDVLALGIPVDGPVGSNNIGAVWLYVLVAGVWTLTGPKITGPGEISQGFFGNSLSLNGAKNILAVGCSNDNISIGAAYIFNISNPEIPLFVQKLLGPVTSSYFGSSVSFSANGSTLAVGAPDYNNQNTPSGSVYIYSNVQTQQSLWQNQFKVLLAPFEMTSFGNTLMLSADGNILAVGAATNAVIYYRTPGQSDDWTSQTLLPIPYDLVRTAGPTNQIFYVSISQDGNTIGIANPQNNNNNGASWIFTQGPLGTWTQNGPGLIGTGGTPNSFQGSGGTLSGDGKVVALVNDAKELWVFV